MSGGKYHLYLSTPTIFCDSYEFPTLEKALNFADSQRGESHCSICYPDGKTWHDWHRNDGLTKTQAKAKFLRLQSAANRATLRNYRHAENHNCIRFVCTCGLENSTIWPSCAKCGRALQMWNTDRAPHVSFWSCPKNHPQGPMEEAMKSGKSIGWQVERKPFVASKIPGHKHVFSNNGGCERNKEFEAKSHEANYWFQKFWSELPRKVMGKDGHIHLSWIKQWYKGTEFAC